MNIETDWYYTWRIVATVFLVYLALDALRDKGIFLW